MPLLVADGATISSTSIRHMLEEGDVAAAAKALGRPHRVEGVVVRGHQRGRGTRGFGAVIAPQVIIIERLQIFSDGNHGRAGGVECDGEDLLGRNTGLSDDVASGRREGAHVIFMRLRGVLGIFAFAMEGIFGDGGSQQAAFAVHQRNSDAQSSKINPGNHRHALSPLNFVCASL